MKCTIVNQTKPNQKQQKRNKIKIRKEESECACRQVGTIAQLLNLHHIMHEICLLYLKKKKKMKVIFFLTLRNCSFSRLFVLSQRDFIDRINKTPDVGEISGKINMKL